MEFIVENWYVIVTGIVFIVGGVMAVLRWRNLSTDKKYEQIRGWLLQAVLGAEREFGSGTGKLKLSSVYDKFCERFLGWQRSCHLKPLANTLMTPSAK